MTTRNEPFAPGTPCWVDLGTSSADKSTAFYTELFGWSAVDAGEEFGHYVQFLSDGHPVGGMMQKEAGATQPDAWCTYISTTNIDESIAKATASGATVIAPSMQVANLGSMALLFDPVGALFGLWQADTFGGFGKYNEPNSVTWDEHHSKDFAKSLSFYTGLFSWGIDKTSDTDEFRYFQGQVNGETVAGLMDSKGFLPPEVPSHWAVYFSVDDADAAIEKATALGGKVIRPAEDTPFGRIADLFDATGALFKIHSVKLKNPS